jgi:phosphoglycolate phosphatase
MGTGARHIAILFDIDGTLIDTGGAGAVSWRLAFDELYGIPADIGQFTDAGMTDPDVGRKTFVAVLAREPERKEFTRLMERRLHYLHQAVAESKGYRVLPGVLELMPRLIEDGYMTGLVTGNVAAAAHIKLHRANLNRFFSFGGYGSDSSDRGEVARTALRRGAYVYGADIAPEQAFAVGDTPRDAEAAHAAGMKCLNVATGHFDEQQLRDGGGDWVIGSLEEPLPP